VSGVGLRGEKGSSGEWKLNENWRGERKTKEKKESGIIKIRIIKREEKKNGAKDKGGKLRDGVKVEDLNEDCYQPVGPVLGVYVRRVEDLGK
jgi:hypothetical protein